MADAKEEADILSKMEVISKEILETMQPMVTANILIDQATSTKGFGRITWQMERAKQSMLMVVVITDSFSIIEDMEEEFLCKKVAFSKEASKTISLKEKELWSAKMDKDIAEVGRIMRSMEKESIYGLMESHIKENTVLASVMELAS